jgi:Xaa-Pro aminopeptidase
MSNMFAERLKQLKKRIRDGGFDALLIVNPIDILYLTGFVGDDSWAVVTAAGRKVTVISDSRFEEQIAREAPQVRLVLREQKMTQALAETVKLLKVGRLAVQETYVSMAIFNAIGKALGKRNIKAWDDGLFEQRAIKTEDEVDAIERAGRIQQKAFRELLDFIKPGMKETEAAAFLEYRIRSLGADGVSFRSIVAADANAALPHAIPGPSKMKKGGIVLIDWGAKVDGYCSDMTRVIGFGKMKPKLRDIYQIVLDAQQAGIEAIKPGVTGKDVDAAARKIIEEAGYGKQFGHGLGHGLGLDIHEQPRLSKQAEEPLEPGHVVTVEPGIYLPGVGGVRIEDDVLVTETGHRVLTDLPKSLESAII